jgi:hypothetical protein
MENIISETFNRIINKRNTYKCIAYIDDKKGKDKIVDAFEIEEFSMNRAFKTAHEVLTIKYPDMGLDLRVFNTKKE